MEIPHSLFTFRNYDNCEVPTTEMGYNLTGPLIFSTGRTMRTIKQLGRQLNIRCLIQFIFIGICPRSKHPKCPGRFIYVGSLNTVKTAILYFFWSSQTTRPNETHIYLHPIHIPQMTGTL